MSTLKTTNIAHPSSASNNIVLDSSARVLVGTSSASADAIAVFLGRSSAPGGTGGEIKLAHPTTNVPASGTLGRIQFGNTGDDRGAEIAAIANQTWTSTAKGSYLTFSTTADGASSPTERMRIRNTGQVWVNQSGNISGTGDGCIFQVTNTASDWSVAVNNSNASPYGIRVLHTTDSNGTGNEFLVCAGSGTVRAAIRSNGGLANYQANNVNLSDRNAKKDISPAADTWDCIKEWEIVNYRYKDQPDDADLNLGVIAQQVAESCPEVITVFEEAKNDQPEKLGVKEQQMYWMAIKALQEAQVRIETLEAKVAALETA